MFNQLKTMNMSNDVIKTEEICDYRIHICRDNYPPCPCKDWDMLGVHLFNSGRSLSEASNYEELFYTSSHSLADAACELACKYVPQKKFIEYINKYLRDSMRFRYDRSDRLWYLEQYHKFGNTDGKWYQMYNFTPDEVKDGICGELSEFLDEEDFIYLLSNCQTEIAVHEWSSCGYCQGDYVEGFSYCTKERFIKRYGGTTKDWQKRAVSAMESEVECIGKWMWGDVLGFVLEKKVRYTKVYEDDEKADEDDYDWEEVDSCWGYYCDEDELIKEVIEEHHLYPSVAA